MRYSTLLFDLDHTLLDSEESEKIAFDTTLRAAGVDDPSVHFPPYAAINRDLWAAVERNEIGPEDVRLTRFERFIACTGIEADPRRLADDFVRGLGAHGELYPGVRAVLDALAGVVTMALVTNGIGEVQRARIERLDIEDYFAAIAISGDVGASKPGTEIFELVFSALGGPAKSSTLMVGDSLSSDIQGGVNFGIDTCWLNATGATPPLRPVPNHEVASLQELHRILPGVDIDQARR